MFVVEDAIAVVVDAIVVYVGGVDVFAEDANSVVLPSLML